LPPLRSGHLTSKGPRSEADDGAEPALGDYVTYTSLIVVFLAICTGLGLRRGRRGSNNLLAAELALAMVCAQLVLLLRP
jgi:hypothetical protein